jgi:hypothetical protein
MCRYLTCSFLALSLFVSACGDDDDKGTNIVDVNGSANNTTANNTAANNTAANNTSTNNTTTNNAAPNNLPDNVGTAAQLLAETGAGQAADMPCEGESSLAFGGDVITLRDIYDYDAEGRLAYIDSFADGMQTAREVRRYVDGRLGRIIVVEAETPLIDLVLDFDYADGRLAGAELAIPDMMGTLNPPLEARDVVYDSDNAWTIATVDNEGNPIESDTYTWEPQSLTFTIDAADGSLTTFEFASAPPLDQLYAWNELEPFEIDAQIVGGSADDDGDGTAETSITATYDGVRLTGLSLDVDGGGSLSYTFAYSCN